MKLIDKYLLRTFVMPLAYCLLAFILLYVIFDLFDKNLRIGTNTLLVLLGAGLVFVIALLADLVVQVTRPRHEVRPAAISEIAENPIPEGSADA